jgi:hypothetical protein
VGGCDGGIVGEKEVGFRYQIWKLISGHSSFRHSILISRSHRSCEAASEGSVNGQDP